jgi:hypothetical protein
MAFYRLKIVHGKSAIFHFRRLKLSKTRTSLVSLQPSSISSLSHINIGIVYDIVAGKSAADIRQSDNRLGSMGFVTTQKIDPDEAPSLTRCQHLSQV